MIKIQIPNKLNSKYTQPKLIITCFLVAILMGIFVLKPIIDGSKDQSNEVNSKIERIESNDQTTCSEANQELGDVPLESVKNSETKRDLLEIQVTCFADEGKFEKSLAAAEELKQYYMDKNDQENSKRLEETIKFISVDKEQLEERSDESQ